VVGEGERRHLELGGARDHARDRIRAVEQREIAVVVEMYEVGMVHGASCAKVQRSVARHAAATRS
jgi:hypothetical protein